MPFAYASAGMGLRQLTNSECMQTIHHAVALILLFTPAVLFWGSVLVGAIALKRLFVRRLNNRRVNASTESGPDLPLLPDRVKGDVPKGLAHIAMIVGINQDNRVVTQKLLTTHRDDLKMLGTSLTVLFEAATCHRKCWGGGHKMEFMAGRVYNLACAAYSLVCIAYYDEALNLTRSLGEIANLVALFHMDDSAFEKWVKMPNDARREAFGPGKVRKRLKSEGGLLLMDDAKYWELCESYTHPTPNTMPNKHNDQQRAICGGFIQERGLAYSLEALTSLTGAIAMFYAALFNFDDSFQELKRLAQSPSGATQTGPDEI
jgi:hypothetical protein